MQKQINPNQLNLIDNTYHGEIPVKFFGSDLTKIDEHRLTGNLKKVFDVLLKIGWHTNEQLYSETGIFQCDRYRRYILEGRISGYTIEKKNFRNGVFEYRIVKLLK